jgi:hypothetical protein
MKSTILVICISLFPVLHCFCQSASPQVFATAGDEFISPDISMSWTLGETMTESLSNTNSTLTQGFNQTKLVITAIGTLVELQYVIVAYPNPTSDFVFLKTDSKNLKNLEYVLYESTGSMLLRKTISSTIESIDFRGLAAGVYLLEVLENQKLVKTFKIIKP